MAYAFDTLGYSKTLRAAGITTEHAEAHAVAAREFIMVDLATKDDLRSALEATKVELRSAIEVATLRLTVRLGSIVAAGIVVLGAFLKLT